MRRRSSRNRKKILLVLVCLLLSIVIVWLLSMAFNKKVERTVAAAAQTETVRDDTVADHDVRYVPDTSVRSYLFLGVDDAGLDYGSFGRGGRTDTILLLVKRDDELRILEISRDTMTEVDTYNTAGNYLSTGVMQINMQYAYGDSPRRSMYLTKKTVSDLLGGIDIHGAVALNMSGIAPVVDALGGIDVYMEEDCSGIDPDYTQGAEVHMDGKEAEHFIRWRDTTESGSNDARMSRHTWFIRQMLAQADSDSVSELLKAADPYLNTDMTAEEMRALYDCKLAETIRLPGQTRRGDLHDEFYVDEDALREILLRLFYTPAGTE